MRMVFSRKESCAPAAGGDRMTSAASTNVAVNFKIGLPCDWRAACTRSPHERSDMRGRIPDIAPLIRATERPGSTSRFGVLNKIVGRLGSPQRQRILGLVVAGLPRLRLRDVVDVAGVFGKAAPR